MYNVVDINSGKVMFENMSKKRANDMIYFWSGMYDLKAMKIS